MYETGTPIVEKDSTRQPLVRHDDVEILVSVEVRDLCGVGGIPGDPDVSGCEPAGAVIEKHGTGALPVAVDGEHQVQVAVSIEIAHADVRCLTRGVVHGAGTREVSGLGRRPTLSAV